MIPVNPVTKVIKDQLENGQDGNVIHFLQIKGTNLGARDAGQSLVKTSSINSWSTGYGFSTVGFSSASLVVSPASNKNVFLIGLSSSPATGLTDAKSKINAGWYFDSDGQAYVWAQKTTRFETSIYNVK